MAVNVNVIGTVALESHGLRDLVSAWAGRTVNYIS